MVKKINILFDATNLAVPLSEGKTRTGIFFAAHNILMGLLNNPEVKVLLYCDSSLLLHLKDAVGKISYLKNIDIINKDVNWEKKLSAVDVYLSPMQKIPDVIENCNHIDKYTLIHDMTPYIFPTYFLKGGDVWFHKMINSVNAKDYYFANSDYTKVDFMRYIKYVNPLHITTTLLACDNKYKRDITNLSEVKSKYNIPNAKKYVFSLCTLEPRKNLLRVVRTFCKFVRDNNLTDLILVLGGGSWGHVINELETELSKNKDVVFRTGYIDECDLVTLYSGAEWFVYTSQYEGFGLPPLEAMACRCPVITSNNSSLPEVVGDAGIMIDWDSDEQHIKAYEKYYFDKDFREMMAKKGFERSKKFSWKKTTDIMIKTMVENKNKGKEMVKEKIVEAGKINILFDAKQLMAVDSMNNNRSGIFWVSYELLKGLLKDKRCHVVLYIDNKLKSKFKKSVEKDDYIKNLMVVDQDADIDGIDVYISPIDPIPDFILGHPTIRSYKIIHDTTGLYFPDKGFSLTMDKLQKNIVVDRLFANSQCTKNDFIKFFPKLKSKGIIVDYLAADERFKPCKDKKAIDEVKRKYNIPLDKKYMLSLSNLAPHKNLMMAVKSFIKYVKDSRRNDIVYVMAGNPWPHFKASLEQEIKSFAKYADLIIQTGYIKDEDQAALYSGAEWFVFPSLYEGFGLPVLEAMQCGCPVVSSNAGSLPEVVGDCALLVSPDDEKGFVDAYKKIASSNNFRKQCSKKSIERAKMFSWKKFTETIVDTMVADLSDDKDIVPIVVHTDNNYVVPTIVTITSLVVNKYKNTPYRIYVLGNKLSHENKKLLSKITGVEVIDHVSRFAQFEGKHQHVSSTDLFKFDLPDVFSQYDKILYLDVDMIIQRDLSELYHIDLEDNYVAAVKDMQGMVLEQHHIRNGLENYFNAGMMLLNLKKMREDNISDKLIDYKLHKDTGHFMSQDALNCVFGDKVKYIDPKYNYMWPNLRAFTDEEIEKFYDITEVEWNNIRYNSYIVHLTNKLKPWKYIEACGAGLWASYYYKSVLKRKRIKYLDIATSSQNVFDKKKVVQFKIPGFSYEGNKFKHTFALLGLKFTYYKNLLGRKILFKNLKLGDFNLLGCGAAEKWGMWSNGYNVKMLLNVPKAKEDLKVIMDINPYVNEKHKTQEVDVFVNDVFVTQWKFNYKADSSKPEFIIPRNLIKKKGKLFIDFRIHNPVSPKELGLGSDGRRLGLGFISMEIVPAVVKENKLKKQWMTLVGKIKKYLPQKKVRSVEAMDGVQIVTKEIVALKNAMDALKNTTENLQKELKALKNEQLTTQKMLVNEKTLLQRKRRLK